MYYPNIPLQLAKYLTVIKSRANVWYIYKKWQYIVTLRNICIPNHYSHSPTLISSKKIRFIDDISIKVDLIRHHEWWKSPKNKPSVNTPDLFLFFVQYCYGQYIQYNQYGLPCFALRVFVCLIYFHILVRLFIFHPCLVDRK